MGERKDKHDKLSGKIQELGVESLALAKQTIFLGFSCPKRLNHTPQFESIVYGSYGISRQPDGSYRMEFKNTDNQQNIADLVDHLRTTGAEANVAGKFLSFKVGDEQKSKLDAFLAKMNERNAIREELGKV